MTERVHQQREKKSTGIEGNQQHSGGSRGLESNRSASKQIKQPMPTQRLDKTPLQGKFDAEQQGEEKEPLQRKFEPVAQTSKPPQGERIAQLEAMMKNSPQMAAQRRFVESIDNSPYVTAQRQKIEGLFGATVQRQEAEESLQTKPETTQRAKPNNTGLPDNLKSGIESLSGMSMDNVKVHYNSSQPAQLNALAYAQGSDIHVGPGQEKHLPHEAWHVVQQAQGRVQPTKQMKEGVPVNDDQGLEREADVMGEKAAQKSASYKSSVKPMVTGGETERGGLDHVSLTEITQCYPRPLEDDEIKSIATLHQRGKNKEEEELTAEDIETMSEGTSALTDFFGAVQCNCFGWALGLDFDTGDKGKLYNWKKDHGGQENFTPPDSAEARIILWGIKEEGGEDKWDVTHASVLLTHAELLKRSGQFKGLNVKKEDLEVSNIPDPFWSSAGGMGFGIMVHPKNWYEGGDFGTALKGMKHP